MSLSTKIRVAVLRGGPSPEYDVSLKTGTSVLTNLPDKYLGLDVLVDKSGVWHVGGLPKSPDKVLNQVDVVWNALHGYYGEDGKVQHILESHAVPFTGSGSFASSLGMNKLLSKEVYAKHNIKTPLHTFVRKAEDVVSRVAEVFKTFLMPAVVKPVSAGSSVGVRVVHTAPELYDAVADALTYGDTALIEEYIRGVEATCGVVENFRGESLHALMPVEIRTTGDIFGADAKARASELDQICPGSFTSAEKKLLGNLATQAHQSLGLRHYSRSDFVLHPKRGVYILETNSLPGLTDQSSLPISLRAGGTTMPQFLDHVLTLARQ